MDAPIVLQDWPGLTLWRCRLDAVLDESTIATLDAAEHARAARFVHELHRRRYVAARAALRAILADVTGETASRLQLCDDALGKPELAHPIGWRFNLSHSEDWALVGVQRGQAPIGVDIEVIRPVEEALALAGRHYTPSEQAALAATADGATQHLAFLRVWTRKEACLKAIGLGLRLAPSSFEAGGGEGLSRAQLLTPDGPVSVEVSSIDAGPGLVAAVARVRA
jgi:4'-phosphopantetheinyl transferase